MTLFVAALIAVVLPPQRMSPVPAFVILPSPKTNCVLSWSWDSFSDYTGNKGTNAIIMSEIWMCDDSQVMDMPQFYRLIGYSDSNSFSVPMTNAARSVYNQLYDTNGVFLGWQTNTFQSGFFMVVGEQHFGFRTTNKNVKASF